MEILNRILSINMIAFAIYSIVYIILLLFSVIIGSVLIFNKYSKKRLGSSRIPNGHIPISIIVPAYNEEITVVSTVKSLLMLDYPLYEIIVVDDGSKDHTSEELIKAFDMICVREPICKRVCCQDEEFVYHTSIENRSVVLVRKKNGGKADALNMGINISKFPYFICMDADSVLQYDSLNAIVQPVLKDARTIAVGGRVCPCNDVEIESGKVKHYRLPKNINACMQVVEYDRTFLSSRLLFDRINGSMIISGAFGLFKKDIVIGAGGYLTQTIGEDMELVVRMHEYCSLLNIPYRISYEEDAICWSQVPEKISDLCKQRKRWHIGLMQSIFRHCYMTVSIKYGFSRFLTLVYFLLYELFSPVIEVVGATTLIMALYTNCFSMTSAILYLFVYGAFGTTLTIASVMLKAYNLDLKLSVADFGKVFLVCVYDAFVIHPILLYIRFMAMVGYRKKKAKWGRIERKKINIK